MSCSSLATRARLTLVAILLALIVAPTAWAQHSNGNLAGRARTGDVVRVENPQTGFHRELTVDESGRYRFAALPPGKYLVNVRHADGSQEPTKQIAVRLGSTVMVR